MTITGVPLRDISCVWLYIYPLKGISELAIHLHASKSGSLLTRIAESLEGFDRRFQRRHELRILSCYIDFESVRKLITKVAEQVRLTDVELMFEMMEVSRGRLPNEAEHELQKIERWCQRHDRTFRWYPIRTGALMHAKGYCVVQRVQGEVGDGMVWIGSGNATAPGLGMSRSRMNIELSSVSTSTEDVTSFLEIWDHLAENTRDISAAVEREDAYAFTYALLASGVFLHDWRDSLRSQVGVRYILTPEGRKAVSVDPQLVALGFDLEQATVNRNPLVAEVDFPSGRSLPPSFTRRYTIDTWLGRWCPRPIWIVVEDVVGRDKAFRTFRQAFLKATESEALDRVIEQEQEIERSLVERGFVATDDGRLSRWREKVEGLRDSEARLSRIFLRFEPFDLPYDYQAREEIESLRDNLFESLAIRSRQSLAARKLLDTEQQGTLNALDLTDDERWELEALLVGEADGTDG